MVVVSFLPPFGCWCLRDLFWCVDRCIDLSRYWYGCISSFVVSGRIVVAGLTIIYLRRPSILALGVIAIGYSAGACLLIAPILPIGVVNRLCKGYRTDKKEY